MLYFKFSIFINLIILVNIIFFRKYKLYICGNFVSKHSCGYKDVLSNYNEIEIYTYSVDNRFFQNHNEPLKAQPIFGIKLF